MTEIDANHMRDVSMPIDSLLKPAVALTIILLVLSLAPYVLLWGFAFNINTAEALLALLAIAFLIVAHEALHAVGWILFGGVSVKSISFGVDRKTLSPYAHADVPMPATGYRIAVLLPGIVTGVLPVIIGTLIGHGWLTFVGAFMVTGAVGDLIVLWAIRAVPNSARVLDHPKNAGCYVLDDSLPIPDSAKEPHNPA
jgi:hypothetical protein